MRTESLSLALLLASLMAVPATAQSLKLKEMETQDKEQVTKLAEATNQACGSQIAFSVDYPSYAHVFDDDNNQKPWAYLANVTDALKHVCQSDAGKTRVQAKIKNVTVSNDARESETLAAGTFHYSVPYRGHSPASIIKWLEANL